MGDHRQGSIAVQIEFVDRPDPRLEAASEHIGAQIDRQLQETGAITTVPLIASGGAGERKHFLDVFNQADVDGALAATVFHSAQISIPELKSYLSAHGIGVREC